ncbi:hypothetical protein YPPY14_4463, partial [Yersinia pestis PY-14]
MIERGNIDNPCFVLIYVNFILFPLL